MVPLAILFIVSTPLFLFSFSFCFGVLQLFSSFVVGELKIGKSKKIFFLSSTIFVLNVYPNL